jgi:cysteinylglycine-S-conjugate dipeptidase
LSLACASKITGMSAEKTPNASEEALREALRLGAPRLISDLCGLMRIPSVSWAGFDADTLEASATRVSELLDEVGLFDSVGVYRQGDGAPAVIARRDATPGWPTVVVYAHHDVQPPGDPDLWDSPAYEPTIRNHRLYGRGSADDKAGIAVHLGALRAVKEVLGSSLNLGVVVFVEGEEENGSPSFPAFITEYHDLLSGDIIVVADSDNPSTTVPAITTRLRGNVTGVLTLSTLDHAVHSGMLGGAVPDAMMVFAAVAQSFYDDQGSLAIEGLDSANPSGAKPSEPVGEAAGLLSGVREIGRGSVSDRLWDSPALTITGLDVPSVENASNTLLPSEGVGGSIPFISQLATRFPQAQIVVTGVEDPDTRAHSPNESLHLGVLWRAALSESVFLALLNRQEPSEFPR